MAYEPDSTTTDVDARSAGKCGFIKKDGQPCANPAGKGTEHLGRGCCKSHGGNGGRAVTHGLYSKIERERIKELLDAAAEVDDIMDFLPHLRMLYVLTVDWVERYGDYRDALIAWHESYEDPEKPARKPTQIMDITAAATLIDRIGAMIERVEKREMRKAVSFETFQAALDICGEYVAIAAREVLEDADLRARLGGAVNGQFANFKDELYRRTGSKAVLEALS